MAISMMATRRSQWERPPLRQKVDVLRCLLADALAAPNGSGLHCGHQEMVTEFQQKWALAAPNGNGLHCGGRFTARVRPAYASSPLPMGAASIAARSRAVHSPPGSDGFLAAPNGSGLHCGDRSDFDGAGETDSPLPMGAASIAAWR